MADDLFAYVSEHPEVLGLEAVWRKQRNDYNRAVRAFKRKWPLKDGRGKVLPILETHSFGIKIVGYQGWCDAPEGWKNEKNGLISPKKSSVIGKQIAKDMAKCSMPDPRRDLPGMPSFVMGTGNGGIAMLSPGVTFMEGKCWATWSKEIKPKGKYEGYDPKLWTPVKLSEFYAAKERADEQEKADA